MNSTDLMAYICKSIIDNAFMTLGFLFNHNSEHSVRIHSQKDILKYNTYLNRSSGSPEECTNYCAGLY